MRTAPHLMKNTQLFILLICFSFFTSLTYAQEVTGEESAVHNFETTVDYKTNARFKGVEPNLRVGQHFAENLLQNRLDLNSKPNYSPFHLPYDFFAMLKTQFTYPAYSLEVPVIIWFRFNLTCTVKDYFLYVISTSIF